MGSKSTPPAVQSMIAADTPNWKPIVTPRSSSKGGTAQRKGPRGKMLDIPGDIASILNDRLG